MVQLTVGNGVLARTSIAIRQYRRRRRSPPGVQPRQSMSRRELKPIENERDCIRCNIRRAKRAAACGYVYSTVHWLPAVSLRQPNLGMRDLARWARPWACAPPAAKAQTGRDEDGRAL